MFRFGIRGARCTGLESARVSEIQLRPGIINILLPAVGSCTSMLKSTIALYAADHKKL